MGAADWARARCAAAAAVHSHLRRPMAGRLGLPLALAVGSHLLSGLVATRPGFGHGDRDGCVALSALPRSRRVLYWAGFPVPTGPGMDSESSAESAAAAAAGETGVPESPGR